MSDSTDISNMKVLVFVSCLVAVYGRPSIVNVPQIVRVPVQTVNEVIPLEFYDPTAHNYNYEYMIDDAVTGDMHGHVEHRHSDNNVTGRYMVLDPDGMLRVVNYRDIGQGFEVDVKRVPYTPKVANVKVAVPQKYTNVHHVPQVKRVYTHHHQGPTYRNKYYINGYNEKVHKQPVRNQPIVVVAPVPTTPRTTVAPTTTTTTQAPTTTTRATTTQQPSTTAYPKVHTLVVEEQPHTLVVEEQPHNSHYYVNMRGAGYNFAWGDDQPHIV